MLQEDLSGLAVGEDQGAGDKTRARTKAGTAIGRFDKIAQHAEVMGGGDNWMRRRGREGGEWEGKEGREK